MRISLVLIGSVFAVYSVASEPVAAQPAPCKPSVQQKRGASIFGALGSAALGFGLGKAGINATPKLTNTMNAFLTDGIACMLTAEEQTRAAGATKTAVNGAVGTKSDWTSSSRPGVSGSSTVVSETKTADGTTCRTVSDVVIVNGEETTVDKRLCRPPGGTGFEMAA